MTDRLDAQPPRAARRWIVALGVAVLCGLGVLSPPAAAAVSPADVALQVSFDPAAAVRLRGQDLVMHDRAARAKVEDVLGGSDVVRVERLFGQSEASLDAARERLLAKGERDVPDLNRHYRVVAADRAGRDRLLAQLRSLAVVDEVISEPAPVPPPATPDFAGRQGYALPAPGGIDAAGVAGLAGGLGENVKIIDIEYAWNDAHEDLAKAAGKLIANGTPRDPFPENNANHGTAVLGELIATVNGFGVSGLASGSEIGMVNASNTFSYALPEAVYIARQNLSPGDVILIEQQYPGIVGSGLPGGSDYVASEYWPAVYDAVTLATQSGIIVVEAAGNGGVNLDAPAYQQPFPRGNPDSGAIIVGAGSGNCGAPANSRLGFSTHGSRVNLQGWGQCVATTGYGTLHSEGGRNAFYASGFGGTSSASPIVAAAAALYSSVYQATTGGRAPSPLAVRRRLVATGTPQAPAPAGHIGPLPNVPAALTDFDFTLPTVTVTGGPAGSTSDSTPTFEFASSEAGSTFQCRIVGQTTPAFSACTSPYTPAPLPNRAYIFEVKATDAALNPGEPSTRAFTIDAIPPAASIATGPSESVSGPTPTFTFSSGEPGVVFSCRAGTPLAPGTFTPCTSPHTTPRLPDGAAVFAVRAADVAGNIGPVASRAFTVDAIAPTVAITGGPSDTTTAAAPTFMFSASEPGATFACRAGAAPVAGAFAACSSPHTTAALALGASAFEVRATDAVGNAGPVAARAFTVLAPPPPMPAPPAPGPPTSSPPGAPPAPLVAAGGLPPTIGPGTRLTVRVSRSGSVRLNRPAISCPAAAPSCTVAAKARRVARGSPQIGASSATIAPGRTATIRFTLTSTARAALRRGRLRATVAITARHADRVATRTVQLTIERRR